MKIISAEVIKYNIKKKDKISFKKCDETHEFTPIKNPLFIEAIDQSVDVLEPVNDGEEFIAKRIGIICKSFTNHYANEDIIGRYYGDIYPLLKDKAYSYFKEVYDSKSSKKLKINLSTDDGLNVIINVSIIYENDEILIISQIDKESTDEYNNYRYLYDEANNIDVNGINDNYILSYNVKEQKYSWSNKFYELLEIEPSEGDESKNLLLDYIVDEDIDIIKTKFTHLSPKTPEVEYNFRILTKNNKLKYVNCTAFAIYDKGYLLRGIFYFFKDITEDKLTIDNLNLLEENLDILQSLSNSAAFYMDASGKHRWTQNIYNIIECDDCDNYDVDKYNIIDECIVADDRDLLDHFSSVLSPENPTVNFKIKITSKKGNLKHLSVFLRNVYDKDGYLISKGMYVYDITNLEKILKDNANILNAFNSIDYNLKTGIIYQDSEGQLRVSKMFKEIIGVYIGWPEGGKEIFVDNLINSKYYEEEYARFINKECDELSLTLYYEFDGKQDQIKILEYFIKRIDDSISGYIRDITDLKEGQIELKKLNNQKSLLIKEIHHRVKNNLQVLSSLLNLEERFYKNKPEQIIESTKKRINSMALIHELTYKSANLETVNLKDYFDIFDNEMYAIFDGNEIIMDNNIDPNINFHIRIVTPLVLIINEFTSNSIKYAFDYESKEKDNIISKNIYLKDGNCIIEYKDNGVGLPEGYDVHNSSGLGWTIINSLVKQLNGTLEEIESEGIGFKITFPIVKDKLILEE